MLFEWNPQKAVINEIKHGVSFELAQTVFDDPFHLSILDDGAHDEERWITIGLAGDGQTLVVVHLYWVIEKNMEMIRIISARKATKVEVTKYEEGI